MTDSGRPVAILGAGLTGLVAANLLARRGRSVVLLDRETRPGGLFRPIQVGDRLLDCYYHHIFRVHRRVIDLVESLGLGPELHWRAVRQGVVEGGRARPLDHAADHLFRALRYPPDLLHDLRFALAMGRLRDAPDLDAQTSMEWIARYQSRRKMERFWKPLLSKKFGAFGDRIGAPWLIDRIMARESSKRHFRRGEVLGCVADGFHRVAERLADKAVAAGVELHLETEVTGLSGDGETIRGIETNHGRLDWDGPIVSTLAADVLTSALPEWAGEAAAPLRGLQYMGCLCVVLRIRRSLSRYYWLSNLDREDFAVVVEQSKLLTTDDHLVYLPRYTPPDFVPDEAAKAAAREAGVSWLGRVFPGFVPEDVAADAVVFDRFAQPIFLRGLVDRRLTTLRPARNLIATDAFLNHPEYARTMDSAIARGERVAEMV